MNEYLAETEAAMTKAETGEFLFDDLRELAASHAQQRIEFEKLIPENISLGLFVVGSFFQAEQSTPLKPERSRVHPPPAAVYGHTLFLFSLCNGNPGCSRFPVL